MTELPIHRILPQLKMALSTGTHAVLIAEPGAGKTTQVPLAFLNESWLEGKRIIMLEPRRIAARSAASYMASSLGEAVGETIGYRVRMDSKIGQNTRIEVVTEGILTRMLQDDPELTGIGMIIFDEFHERNLQADTGLAFAMESQSVLREDLRLLVMSATLEAEPVARLLGDAPVIVSEGRAFPVSTHYVRSFSLDELHKGAANAILRALSEQQGDILVFLPGAREIRKTANELVRTGLSQDVVIRELYSALPAEKQDEAIRRDSNGRRKIVLSTSIAESSITIEGIKTVVDSGYMRTEVFSPRTGLPQLITRRLSRASADQRRGRAGRVSAGVCYRLWSEEEHRHLPESTIPAIRESDLTPLALELAVWGTRDPEQLAWLDAPPRPALAQGQALLRQLSALDDSGSITQHGREMALLGLHPRLAHMLIRAQEIGEASLAIRIAVLLQERDIMSRGKAIRDQDLRSRVERLLLFERQGQRSAEQDMTSEAVLQRMKQEIRKLHTQLNVAYTISGNLNFCGLLLSFAYPERIAKNRGGSGFLMRSGRGVKLVSVQPMSRAQYIVVAAVDDQGADGNIQLASEMDELWLDKYYYDEMEQRKEVVWDSASGSIRARQKLMLGALVIKEQAYSNPTGEEIALALLQGIRQEGLGLLQWSKPALQLRERLAFMFRHDPEGNWPDVSDEGLLNQAEEWLLPYLEGLRNRNDIRRLAPGTLLEHMLSWEQKQQLQKEAPTHIRVPSGSLIPVNYSDPEQPFLAVRLQEMFGLQDTPRIAEGRVALTLHLLSPAQRPVQVTSDLSSFWRSGYFEVKKDLKGRYPKHYWPDDPMEATATHRTRPKA
ncbi:ATP-dependent RNA helicase HrpB [Paenibacillus sp. GM2FR]|uniref:ATP-dependent helicase HrpB n=1 Tax=Paenibacillus sp. GM2FR TaxID=2059268 RepID=UPI000C2797BF|nr:ATP-dependent helicase HrpB [Paenibacillus sp. GM2FR]PJN55935.1 ATP-dependent RNA helicase HrpB [Paenibacillus sp. GM2FR]